MEMENLTEYASPTAGWFHSLMAPSNPADTKIGLVGEAAMQLLLMLMMVMFLVGMGVVWFSGNEVNDGKDRPIRTGSNDRIS